MNVWIVNPYGNLPDEGWRDYRSTMLANALERAGHNAIWWVSNFEHRSKQFRSDDYRELSISPRFRVHLVPSSRYAGHISFARIRYERKFAYNFARFARRHEPPDVIVIADPSLFTSGPVVEYASGQNIRLIVDVLDLWPELFHMLLPKPLTWFGRLLFAPLYRRRAKLFRRADALVAASQDYLSLAQSIAPNVPAELAYLGIDLSAFRCVATPLIPCNGLNLPRKGADDVWAIYAGTLGNNYDIDTIIQSARIILAKAPELKILIAGDGPLRSKIEAVIAAGLSNMLFLGSLPVDDLTRLYRKCDISLSTYRGNSTVAFPVKAYDYLAAGLPVVNSLHKDWGRLLKAENIGLQYESENPSSLASALIYLADNREELAEMRLKALDIAELFDCRLQHDKYVKFIERIVR